MKKYIHSLLSEEVHPVEETKLSNWNALCQVMQKRLWDSVEQRTIPLPIWHVETLSYRRGLPSQTLSSSKSLLGEWLGKSRKPIWKVAAACPQWSFRDRRGGTRQCVGIEGAQDVPPLNTPLWNIDDLEWKEPGKQQLQGSSPTWCFLPHKRVLEFPLRKVALLYQKEHPNLQRLGSDAEMGWYQQGDERVSPFVPPSLHDVSSSHFPTVYCASPNLVSSFLHKFIICLKHTEAFLPLNT